MNYVEIGDKVLGPNPSGEGLVHANFLGVEPPFTNRPGILWVLYIAGEREGTIGRVGFDRVMPADWIGLSA